MSNSFHAPRLLAALLCAAPLSAQTPEYTVELLGPGVVINDMNASGEVVGWISLGGVNGFVARPGGNYEILPLPPGYASAWAQGINDAGVVVGSASTGSFPEFGVAAAWYPDGQGGYTTEIFGALPGHTQSTAYDVNNRGDIVGWSLVPGFQGGPTVWFNSPTGLVDVSALGGPSGPKEINDQGVIVGINGPLFDIDTNAVIPLPPFPAGFTGFQGWAINENNELAGKGFHGSQRSAAIWTQAGGWQSISVLFGQSALVQAFDINASGVAYAEVPTPAARFEGVGTVSLVSLLSPADQARWSFSINLGGAVNDAGMIAAIGTDGDTGQSGVVLLTPVPAPTTSFCDAGDGSLAACPCANPGLPDTGCDLQQSTGGVRLAVVGQTSAPSNSVTWEASGFPAGSTPSAVVIRATDVDPSRPIVFGDGLRCVGLPITRMAAGFAIGGTATLTHGHGAAAGPGTFAYQVWFRNTPMAFCDPAAAFNLSNGQTVTW